MSSWPWSVLEVSPNVETGDIKRAYARKLRVTNPEDDPAGFQALREAYEAALAQKKWQTAPQTYYQPHEDALAQADEPEPEPQPTRVASAEARIVDLDPEPARPASAVPLSADAREELWEAQGTLARLLRSGADEPTLKAAFRAVARSPALENVILYNDIEHWLASLLAHGAPASDVLLADAIALFNWDLQQNRRDLNADVNHVLWRAAVEGHLATLRKKSSSQHKAYRLMLEPCPKGFWGEMRMGWHAKRMQAFLARLHTAPGVADTFDPDTLDAWTDAVMPQHGRSRFRWSRLGGVLGRAAKGLMWVALVVAAVAAMVVLDIARDGSDFSAPADPATACRDAARGAPLPEPGACDRALAQEPVTLAVRGDAALLSMRLNKYPEARLQWDLVLETSPTDARALYGRGLTRLAQQDMPGLDDMRQALGADAGLAETFKGYGFPPQKGVEPGKPPTAPELSNSDKARGRQVVYPDWLLKPSAEAYAKYYPDLAARQEKAGRVTLNCEAGKDGMLTACIVMSETPQDLGFADAALGMMTEARMKPATVDGVPTGGWRVNIPVSFTMKK